MGRTRLHHQIIIGIEQTLLSIDSKGTYTLQNLHYGYSRSHMSGEGGIFIESHKNNHPGTIFGNYFVDNLSGRITNFVFYIHNIGFILINV